MCPDCRSYEVRRRKRDGITLYLASFFGRWPYRCDNCGVEFFLKKRYTRHQPAGEGDEPEGPEPEA